MKAALALGGLLALTAAARVARSDEGPRPVPRPVPTSTSQPTGSTSGAAKSGGCSIEPGEGAALGLVPLALGLLAVARRRRRA